LKHKIIKIEGISTTFCCDEDLQKFLDVINISHNENLELFHDAAFITCEYLIAYDRYDAFPNSTLGYFYDAGQVFAYSKGLSTFEGSGIHQFLEKLNSKNIENYKILRFRDDYRIIGDSQGERSLCPS
jgi:hypothetical protein